MALKFGNIRHRHGAIMESGFVFITNRREMIDGRLACNCGASPPSRPCAWNDPAGAVNDGRMIRKYAAHRKIGVQTFRLVLCGRAHSQDEQPATVSGRTNQPAAVPAFISAPLMMRVAERAEGDPVRRAGCSRVTVFARLLAPASLDRVPPHQTGQR